MGGEMKFDYDAACSPPSAGLIAMAAMPLLAALVKDTRMRVHLKMHPDTYTNMTQRGGLDPWIAVVMPHNIVMASYSMPADEIHAVVSGPSTYNAEVIVGRIRNVGRW